MHRRSFLKAAATTCLGGLLPGCGVFNPCEPPRDFDEEEQELFGEALDGIHPSRLWDTHVHLIGRGDSHSGIWVNPRFRKFRHLGWNTRYKFYLDAACLDEDEDEIDTGYVRQLLNLHLQMPKRGKLMLLAFDYYHGEEGKRDLERSTLHVPNAYAARLAARYPREFEWAASIHPYREDCLEALEQAAAHDARAVKWLPQAMGMDPASPLCDRFYERVAALGLPLLVHVGREHAMPVPDQSLGNPLRLRRALEHGVRVIAAHCGREADGVDLDRGPHGPRRDNFELFSRLMENPDYERLLLGDVSAVFLTIHDNAPARAILERTEWHPRLLYGSDYPLPAIRPLIDTDRFVGLGMLKKTGAKALERVRRYNPMLYHLLLLRLLRYNGKSLRPEVFHTRDHLLPQAA